MNFNSLYKTGCMDKYSRLSQKLGNLRDSLFYYQEAEQKLDTESSVKIIANLL